jgi:hypothetical protein
VPTACPASHFRITRCGPAVAQSSTSKASDDLQRTPSGNSSESVGVFASFDVLEQLPRLINNGETTNGTKRLNAMRE